jgi:uncharacterized delta-60 repeat protein
MIRLNDAGSLDYSFGANGKIIMRIEPNYTNCQSLAVNNEGKIILAALTNQGLFVIGCNSDGTIDSTFGSNGTSFIQNATNIFSLNIQPDQKILFTCSMNDGTTSLIRLNENGNYDSTFGINGKAGTTFGFNYGECDSKLILLNDNKILVSGPSSEGDASVERHNEDGSIDSTFGVNGIINVHYSRYHYILHWDRVRGLEIYDSSKFMLHVEMKEYFDSDHNDEFDCLLRYDLTGEIDSTFGENGMAILKDALFPEYLLSFLVQSSGKIVVTGTNGFHESYLIGLTSNGSIDTTFGYNGRAYSQFMLSTARLQSDDKIVDAGYFINEEYSFIKEYAAERFKPDGSLDKFGSGGYLIIKEEGDPGQKMEIEKVVQQTDEKILIMCDAGGIIELFRLKTDGTPDSSFAINGKYSIAKAYCENSDMAIQSDGRILISSVIYKDSQTYNALFRLNSDGSLDNSFGTNGCITLDWIAYFNDDHDYCTFENVSHKITLLENDDIILSVGGDWYNFTHPLIDSSGTFITKYNKNGLKYNSFGDNGSVFFPHLSNTSFLQSNTKLIVAFANGIIRLNLDGSFDKYFGTRGHTYINNFNIKCGALQDDCKLVFGGNYYSEDYDTASWGFARLNANGLIDSTFGIEGKVSLRYYSYECYPSMYMYLVNSIAIQSDNKIICTGNNCHSLKVFRLNTDGTMDSTFVQDEQKEILGYGNSVALQSDGKILVGGKSGFDMLLARYLATSYPTSPYQVCETDSVFYDDPTYINSYETNLDSYINIFPNPAGNSVSIRISKEMNEKLVCHLYDIKGLEIYCRPLTNLVSDIDLSNYPKGLYYIKISGSKECIMNKLIKM